MEPSLIESKPIEIESTLVPLMASSYLEEENHLGQSIDTALRDTKTEMKTSENAVGASRRPFILWQAVGTRQLSLAPL